MRASRITQGPARGCRLPRRRGVGRLKLVRGDVSETAPADERLGTRAGRAALRSSATTAMKRRTRVRPPPLLRLRHGAVVEPGSARLWGGQRSARIRRQSHRACSFDPRAFTRRSFQSFLNRFAAKRKQATDNTEAERARRTAAAAREKPPAATTSSRCVGPRRGCGMSPFVAGSDHRRARTREVNSGSGRARGIERSPRGIPHCGTRTSRCATAGMSPRLAVWSTGTPGRPPSTRPTFHRTAAGPEDEVVAPMSVSEHNPRSIDAPIEEMRGNRCLVSGGGVQRRGIKQLWAPAILEYRGVPCWSSTTTRRRLRKGCRGEMRKCGLFRWSFVASRRWSSGPSSPSVPQRAVSARSVNGRSRVRWRKPPATCSRGGRCASTGAGPEPPTRRRASRR